MAHPIILGIDEVGRGPWAGPLVVGAVILGDKFQTISNSLNKEQDGELARLYQQLTDSKKLTATKRERLSPLILQHAAASATGWVSSTELDQYGLSAALKLATRRAVKQILAKKIVFSEIIIDGTNNFLKNTPLEERVTTLPKADTLIKEVSAASIIAKVARDHYMAELETKYPGYGFAKHAGYGTALHKAALLERGPCPEHRQSFRPIRELIDRDTKSAQPKTPNSGQIAEQSVAQYLAQHGHTILEHNYKTKYYEIDLISSKNGMIFFTEVKYSHSAAREGTPLVRINIKKQQQMHFAATAFLQSHPKYQALQPQLAVAAVTGKKYQIADWFVLN